MRPRLNSALYTVLTFILLSFYITTVWYMFPSFSDLSSFIWSGIEPVPYLVWALIGGILGALFFYLREPIERVIGSPLKKLGMFLLFWLGASILFAAISSGSDLQNGIRESGLIRIWLVMVFSLVVILPTFLSSMAALSCSKRYYLLSITALLLVPALCMVFSQAESARFLHQPPLPSFVGALSLFGFVESIHWRRRHNEVISELGEEEGGGNVRSLFTRQLLWASVFILAATVLAALPFFLSALPAEGLARPLGLYEMDTVYGKAFLGIIVLAPLGIFPIYRMIRERFKGNGGV